MYKILYHFKLLLDQKMIWIVFATILIARFSKSIGFKTTFPRFHRQFGVHSNKHYHCDVTVLGGGPAGTTIAWLLQERHNLKVALVDPKGNNGASWYPNYGEWQDEWHWLSQKLNLSEMKACTTNEWDSTHCYFGGSGNIPASHRLQIPRPYVRVDRVKLQNLLLSKFKKANGEIFSSRISAKRIGSNVFDKNLSHFGNGSTIILENRDVLESKVVIDATGFESKLIAKESPHVARASATKLEEGYQIAYGFIAKCSGTGPYDPNAMTLFDYRTDHFDHDPTWKKDAEKRPTFMYVMPLSKNEDGTMRVFWEETSLIGAGFRRLSFEECKRRAMKRLKYHGIEIYDIEEEEYCYIPMGGELPAADQRIIAFGGAAKMVHPSTGYQVNRMMAAASDLAETISSNLKTNKKPDQIAAKAYETMWNYSNRLQRDFQAFGGDLFMRQHVHILRGFFSAFFSLKQEIWSGFLAGWPGLPNNEYHDRWDKRVAFALKMLMKSPPDVAMTIILHSINYTLKYGPNSVLRSLLPPQCGNLINLNLRLNSSPADSCPDVEEKGDISAKEEARRMMQQFAEEKMSRGKDFSSRHYPLTTEFPAPFDAD